MLRIFLTFVLILILSLDIGYTKHARAHELAFEYAGLSLASTAQDLLRRYPDSTFEAHNYFQLSAKDTHDHIFSIELFGPHRNARLRLGFESPERTYPTCKQIEKLLISRYAKPSNVATFNEESVKNRYLSWTLTRESVSLYCFKRAQDTDYQAEAIAVAPH
ncbi:hypothetical protein [Undibacterium sp. Ren11W]|uniref:hypothetical protein n=1 Tax=Undibacterium sp. Ren11W TaxID=3413045 RepID=UPI003BF1F847